MFKLHKSFFPSTEGFMPYVGLFNIIIPLLFILQETIGKMFLGLFLLITLLILYRQAYWSPQQVLYILPVKFLITLLFAFLYHPMYLYLVFIFVYHLTNLPQKWMYIFSGSFIISSLVVIFTADIAAPFYLLFLPPLFGGSFMPFIMKASLRYKEMSEELALALHQLEKKNQELVTLEESKKKMLADLSHDLKTPMTTIQGYSKVLVDGLASNPHQEKKYLQYIHDKSIRVTSLIDELFMFAKLDTPDLQVHKEKSDLCEFIREVIVEYYHLIEEKNMQLIVDIPKTNIDYSFDKRLFYRALSNLLENAIKYNPEGTTVFIRLRKRTDSMMIEVADNGVHISDELASAIFEPFVRGDKSRKEDDGSGLGLSISRKIVELHSGSIEIDTNPPNWSKRFTIELPQAVNLS